MKRASGKSLFVVILVLVLLAVAGVIVAYFTMARPAPIQADAILELDLTRPFPDYVSEDPFAWAFGEGRPRLRQVVEALERAADDDRIVAVLARTGSAPMGLATIQELRDAISAYRESGKPAVAWADTFGEFGPGNRGYYLATAFERVYMQPSGDVGLTGVLYESQFLRGALDKLGMVPQMDHRYEYKNAMNSYTQTEFTPAHEQALSELAGSHFDQIAGGVAAGRGLPEEGVRRLFERGPFLGAEAEEESLVDGLMYLDEVRDALAEEVGAGAVTVRLARYVRRDRELRLGGTTVAMVYGVGTVLRGESEFDPWSGPVMGAETVAGALRDAVDDDDVEAILFRVDSPGGSYVASDTIWREVVRARDAGKPVIVSMGDVAASGGYFVAMAADGIVAQPGTITGSIGVYGGKLVARETWGKVGVTFDEVASGSRATMWSANHTFDPGQWERMQTSLDRIYQDFTSKVAEGREMDVDEVHEVARGRIWTGADAAGLGLVDELGGYPAAYRRIRQALELDEGARLDLEVFPRPRNPFELLSERRFPFASAEAARSLAQLVRTLRPAVELARRLGLLEEPPAPLSLPPLVGSY